jgi:lipopolysaccharide transport system permease protein
MSQIISENSPNTLGVPDQPPSPGIGRGAGGEGSAVLFLRPSRGLANLNLKDLWIYRELVYFLTWRDLKVRYKQTVLGAAWAIIQPLIQMVIYTLLFHGIAKLGSEGLPYPLFNYAALLPWGLFTKAISDAARSLVTNRSMITKVYFPRLVIPVSSILSGLVDFGIAFVVLIGLVIYYHVNPAAGFDFKFTPALLTLPFFLLLAIITSLGVSLWFSALNVLYRDVGYVIPFLTQVWFFITPIVYSSTEIKGRWQLLYSLNPMTGVVEGFRWALFGVEYTHASMLAISTLVSLVVLITGLFYFRSMERTFADEI